MEERGLRIDRKRSDRSVPLFSLLDSGWVIKRKGNSRSLASQTKKDAVEGTFYNVSAGFCVTKGAPMNRKLYVANLPPQAGESELRALFSKAGSVMSVKIVRDRQTGNPGGIAFVEMSTQWEARRAASMLNRQDFQGQPLQVREARQNRGFRGR